MAETLLMLQELAYTIATQEGLDADILRRQIEQESQWNPQAVNPVSGCLGLGQLNPRYGRWFIWMHGRRLIPGWSNVFEGEGWTDDYVREVLLVPEYNLTIAAREMARLLNHGERNNLGGYEYALAAYNWGAGNVARLRTLYPRSWMARLPWETRLYLARVLLNTDARKERGIA